MTQLTNRLASETSPYLQQHADNPVHWQPWDEAALAVARESGKPILLSIGYSACHWCHVMAHESFEDSEIAEVMNKLFVNIKVDREERPDLDKIYQSAHHLLNQRGGGWPLTVILTPDEQIPFFAGTYFPNTPKHNMPAFADILQRVDDFYRQHPDEINKQNNSLLDALHRLANMSANTSAELTAFPIDACRQQLAKTYDKEFAGFGDAPKFPHPTNLEFLLRHYLSTQQSGFADKSSLQMLTSTLTAMANGGLFDQLGGGFYRYSVDKHWAIPHFEKMLYDNGPLLSLYSQAAQIFKNDTPYHDIAIETAEWLMREMTSNEGAYYSTLDADSEGKEGTFYIWTNEELKQLLSANEYLIAEQYFGLDGHHNFEGKWHLNIHSDICTISEKLSQTEETIDETLTLIKQKLFQHRAKRIAPGRDEKILTAWNALMIKGMVIAGRLFKRDEFIHSGQTAIDFIHETLFKNGRLLATCKDGKSHIMAYLDDYVFLIDALLESLQAQWRTKDCEFAIALADTVMEYFYDQDNGGFYFTAKDHETLIQRPKPLMDEAIPAGNGIAAYVLNRLGHLIGEQRYIDAAEKTLHYAWPSITEIPYAHAALLFALDEILNPPSILVIRGSNDECIQWQQESDKHYQLNKLVFSIPTTATNLPGTLNERKAKNIPIAYACTGTSCKPPISDINELESIFG